MCGGCFFVHRVLICTGFYIQLLITRCLRTGKKKENKYLPLKCTLWNKIFYRYYLNTDQSVHVLKFAPFPVPDRVHKTYHNNKKKLWPWKSLIEFLLHLLLFLISFFFPSYSITTHNTVNNPIFYSSDQLLYWRYANRCLLVSLELDTQSRCQQTQTL